jgi:hypothetical protein
MVTPFSIVVVDSTVPKTVLIPFFPLRIWEVTRVVVEREGEPRGITVVEVGREMTVVVPGAMRVSTLAPLGATGRVSGSNEEIQGV